MTFPVPACAFLPSTAPPADGYGLFQLHQQAPRRRDDSDFQLRKLQARLYVHRRYRRGCAPRHAQAAGAENGADGLPVPPYALYNIGNSQPENLLDFVRILSEELVRAGVLPENYDFAAHQALVPMQPGDVPVTYADTAPLERDFGFRPHTPLREDLRRFAQWYHDFYM